MEKVVFIGLSVVFIQLLIVLAFGFLILGLLQLRMFKSKTIGQFPRAKLGEIFHYLEPMKRTSTRHELPRNIQSALSENPPDLPQDLKSEGPTAVEELLYRGIGIGTRERGTKYSPPNTWTLGTVRYFTLAQQDMQDQESVNVDIKGIV